MSFLLDLLAIGILNIPWCCDLDRPTRRKYILKLKGCSTFRMNEETWTNGHMKVFIETVKDDLEPFIVQFEFSSCSFDCRWKFSARNVLNFKQCFSAIFVSYVLNKWLIALSGAHLSSYGCTISRKKLYMDLVKLDFSRLRIQLDGCILSVNQCLLLTSKWLY